MMAHDQLGKDTVFAQAARRADEIALTQSIEAACEDAGIDIDELGHVAEQRALRAVMRESGRHLEMLVGSIVPTAIPLNEIERHNLMARAAVYMDGILIGWAARSLEGGLPAADDVEFIADSLRLFADIDEGENVDSDRLRALADKLEGKESE